MNLLPLFAPTSHTSIADRFTKSLPATTHRSLLTIGDIFPTPIAVAPATDAPPAIVDPRPAVASTATAASPVTSGLVPSTPTLPIVLDTGASFTITPFALDFLPVTQVPSSALVTSASVTSALVTSIAKVASTPLDPYTLITREDTAFSVDLLSTDSDSVEFASTFDSFEFREFGTATLVFISNSKLNTILVEPTLDWTDWFDWIPLPRLTPPESYFHIFGLNYFQAFALFHLIPIWTYCLLRFAFNLEQYLEVMLWSPSVEHFGFQLLLFLNSKVNDIELRYTQLLQGIDL